MTNVCRQQLRGPHYVQMSTSAIVNFSSDNMPGYMQYQNIYWCIAYSILIPAIIFFKSKYYSCAVFAIELNRNSLFQIHDSQCRLKQTHVKLVDEQFLFRILCRAGSRGFIYTNQHKSFAKLQDINSPNDNNDDENNNNDDNNYNDNNDNNDHDNNDNNNKKKDKNNTHNNDNENNNDNDNGSDNDDDNNDNNMIIITTI